MEKSVILYLLGRLVLAEAGVFLIPLMVASLTGEGAFEIFLSSFIFCASLGLWMVRKYSVVIDKITMREGVAITAFGWILATTLGMLPYVFGGYLGLLDGIFESISGFSGAGATVITSIETLPSSILLWRSMTHWFGGLGIIVIFIALLPQTGQSTVYMYNAETTGPTRDRMMPKIREMAAALFKMYLALTVIAAVIYFLCGMDMLIAIDHAMATIGAGGFSTYDSSAMKFDNLWLEGWMTFFMFFVGGNFALYYAAYKNGWSEIAKNSEFKAYVCIVSGAIVLIALNLCLTQGYSFGEAFRYASFQSASLSTTGFVSADFEQWPPFSKAVILVLMLIGGCAGSTAGGIKVVRIVLLLKNIYRIVEQKLHPQMVREVRLNGYLVEPSMLPRVGKFFALYILLVMLWTFLLTLDGLKLFDAFSISISTMGTVGPAFGVAGATQNYASLSDFVKCVICISMLLGRLEMFTFLLLLRKDFWQKRGKW